MARVIQLRRGTTAQNDAFTGLLGEVTFDTDAKTLRVHDGETLGGIPLARADQVAQSAAPDIDINNIPDAFWDAIMANMDSHFMRYHDSADIELTRGVYIDFCFDINHPALTAWAELVCVSPQAGYATGDVVASFGIGAHVCPAPNLWRDANGVHVRLMVGEQAFWVLHKETGMQTNITPENWRIKMRLCY